MPQLNTSNECALVKSDDGTPMCNIHKAPLTKQATYGAAAPGLEQLSSWLCPVSKKLIIHKGE